MPRNPRPYQRQQGACKHYCFTYNNPTQTPEELIELFKENVTFMIFQKEKGQNGTVHYQGYLELKKPQRYTALNKIQKMHYQKRLGSVVQAVDYCKKKDDTYVDGPWEHGKSSIDTSQQGKRNDLLPLYEAARAGKTLEEIAEIAPATYMRNYRAVQHVRQMKAFQNPGLRPKLKVKLFYGAPGTGKTRLAYMMEKGLYAIPCGKDIWFDNYSGEVILLFDDFSGM